MNFKATLILMVAVAFVSSICLTVVSAQTGEWGKYSLRSTEDMERLAEAVKGVNYIKVFVSTNVSSDKTLKNLATQQKELNSMLMDWVHLWLSTWLEKSTTMQVKKDDKTDAEATFALVVFIDSSLDGKGYTLNATATLWRKVSVFPSVATAVPFEAPVWESVQAKFTVQRDMDSLKRELKDMSMSLIEEFVRALPKTYKPQ